MDVASVCITRHRHVIDELREKEDSGAMVMFSTLSNTSNRALELRCRLRGYGRRCCVFAFFVVLLTPREILIAKGILSAGSRRVRGAERWSPWKILILSSS